jgi:cyclic pyranopterin phosphate synthase
MIGPMLHDGFSRKFSYLRLSVTEVCNFSCRYCLPEGYLKGARAPDSGDSREKELSLREIEHLLQGVALAGFSKLRLTGGEPTVRKDLLQIIGAAKRMGTFRQIALSTNGWNLERMAQAFFEAGLTHVNVSVDSLDPGRFAALTGRTGSVLESILRGIEKCLQLGFTRVKLNAVLHADTALLELDRFLEHVKDRAVSARFIELMKTRARSGYRDRHFASAGGLRFALLARGWQQRARGEQEGPAVEYVHPDYRGSIGLISPHSDGFCESCNRLRVTSRGRLRLCLFGEEEFSLRPWLQDAEGARQLPQVFSELLEKKPAAHLLQSGRSGMLNSFSEVGG